MLQDVITKYTLIILSYELITLDIVKAKIIDILIDKLIYIIFGIVIYIIGTILNNISCCPKYSPEEKEILKLMKAGDKMTRLNGNTDGIQYYKSARLKIDASLPFIDISDDILSKMEKIESGLPSWTGRSGKKKKKKPD